MATCESSITQAHARATGRMVQHRFINTNAIGVVCRLALAAVLALLLPAGWRTPPAALHASAAGAGKSAAGPYLFWTNSGPVGGTTIGRAWLDGSHVNNSFVTGGASGEWLCYVAVAGKYLYWGIGVQSGQDAIGRAKLDGTGVNQHFISSPDGPVCGVAVARGLIYWASYASGDIGQASLDGSFVNTHFISSLGVTNVASCSSGICSPVGLAVDSKHIYWGEVGSIGRANLDGTGVDQHFITGLDSASGVAVSSKYIYWTDQGSNHPPGAIGRARLDGTAVQRDFIKGKGLVKGLVEPCGLAITDKYIFWADNGLGNTNPNGTTVGRANLDGTGVQPRFISGLHAPCGVAVGP